MGAVEDDGDNEVFELLDERDSSDGFGDILDEGEDDEESTFEVSSSSAGSAPEGEKEGEGTDGVSQSNGFKSESSSIMSIVSDVEGGKSDSSSAW